MSDNKTFIIAACAMLTAIFASMRIEKMDKRVTALERAPRTYIETQYADGATTGTKGDAK